MNEYHEKILALSKKIIDDKDYTSLVLLLKCLDRAVKERHNITNMPDTPYWEMGFWGDKN